MRQTDRDRETQTDRDTERAFVLLHCQPGHSAQDAETERRERDREKQRQQTDNQ